MLKRIFIFTSFLYFCSCVSVDFQKEEIQRDLEVQFHKPPSPFEEFEAQHLDRAWRNSQNGNSISYLSECNRQANPNLKSIHKGVVKGLENVKTDSLEFKNYNHRKALFSEVSGDVDGVSSKMKLVILKKNSCIYILTYVALLDTFEKDSKSFDKFVERFVVK